MVHPNFKMTRAIGTLIGSLVGAGVFGLPFAFSQSGAAIGTAWLLLLAAMMLALFLMYAEVSIQTAGTHRLGGYAARYLGPRWNGIATVLMGLTLGGAMLAHLIVGGRFLFTFLHPFFGGGELVYGLVLACFVAMVTWRGTQFTVRTEGVVIGILLFLFAFAVFAAWPSFIPENLARIHWSSAFLPYGVVLFALSGLGAVPEMKDILGAQKRSLPYAIVFGLSLVVALYLVFSLSVLGVTGEQTTPAAFVGLAAVLGSSFGVISSLLGSLTVFSIFSMSSLQLQNSLHVDMRVPRAAAWALASFLPPLLFLAGLRGFIHVIGFVGAVFAGGIGVLVVCIYERMRRSPVCHEHHCLNVPSPLSFLIAALFAAGIIAACAAFFF